MKYPISNQSETQKIIEQQTEELEKILIEKIKKLPSKLHESGEHELAFMLEDWHFKDVGAFVNFFKDIGYSIELEHQGIGRHFTIDDYKLTQEYKLVIRKEIARY